MVYLLLAVLALSGCASVGYVDAKGRDCRHNMVLAFFQWSTCDEKQEPLAIERHQINAQIDK